MKNLKKVIILLLLLLGGTLSTYSQESYLDSIYVQIDDNMELSMAIYDYEALDEKVGMDLKSLQSILKDNQDIPENESYSITYEPNKLLTIKHIEPGERIIWKNGKQTRYRVNNQCNIYSDHYRLQIKFNELEKIISDSLISKIKEVIDTTNGIRGRFATTYNYSYQGGQLVHNKELDKINGQMDVLSLKGGVGVNLIKSQPVIDLSAEIALIFSKKGILKNQYYLSYNQLDVFSSNNKINLNGFINLGYRYNLSNTIKNTNWLGVDLGYLVVRHGDFLGKNTFKLGINWEIGKYMSISPQIYSSGDFTELYPVVRLGIGF